VKTVTTLPELRAARALHEEPVGLVPTMGFLHPGHLSLVHRARAECASVIVSIFVNPTQFGPGEDLATYPRDLPQDLATLEAAGVDLTWTPTPEVMYPPGFQTWVTVEELTKRLEGAERPGHFRGVATVVTKLFTAVQPQKAYFGQKDAQQATVIQQLNRDLNFPIQIEICPTMREPDGLAMSSRNAHLDPTERQSAIVLFRALTRAEAAFAEGERDAGTLRNVVIGIIATEPLAELQYVSCADPHTLQELCTVTERALLSVAARVGRVRLIDNVYLSAGKGRNRRCY
jgi:pantoate--beta-alanine ligase